MQGIIKEQKFEQPRVFTAPDYLYYDPKYVPYPVGLNNIGGLDCWCNSMLQLLLGIPSMNRLLLEYEDTLSNNIFAVEYIRLVRQTLENRQLDHDASAKIITAFKKRAAETNVTSLQPIIDGQYVNNMQCVDEAFCVFIDLLNCPAVENLFTNIYEYSWRCRDCKETFIKKEKSLRIQLDPTIKLPKQDDFCDYLRIHAVDLEGYTCEKCNCKNPILNKVEKLRVLREVVVITFNKFSGKTLTPYPKILKFNSCGGKSPLVYKVIGRIEHRGTMRGGHYEADSFRNGNWYHLNDINREDGNISPTAETYMVAYHIVNTATA